MIVAQSVQCISDNSAMATRGSCVHVANGQKNRNPGRQQVWLPDQQWHQPQQLSNSTTFEILQHLI